MIDNAWHTSLPRMVTMEESLSSVCLQQALKRRSFSGLTSMLSRHDSPSYCPAPQPVKGRLLVQGLGNWLSHLDWAGQRRALHSWGLSTLPCSIEILKCPFHINGGS